MKISFIALNGNGAESVQSATDHARKVLASFGKTEFKLCDSLQQISSSLTDAFASSDVTVFGVETKSYNKTKFAVLKAMHIDTADNELVRERLGERPDLTASQYDAHCAMPANAQVFLTSDGLYSGFAIEAGKQRFVMIALDKLRMDTVFAKGLVPYLDSCVTEEIDEVEDDMPEEAGMSCIDDTVALLRSYGKKVYFASTPSGEIVKSLCSDHDTENAIIFTDYTAARGTEAPRSYIADLARYAIPEDSGDLGAAVSNVFTGVSNDTGEQKYNIYVSVADSNVSRVLRFSSQPGETPDELVQAAVEMLMDMICDKCKASAEAEANAGERTEQESDEEKRRRKKGGAGIVFFVILALIAACVVFMIVKGRTNVTGAENAAVSAFDANSAEYLPEETEAETAFPEEESSTEEIEEISSEENVAG